MLTAMTAAWDPRQKGSVGHLGHATHRAHPAPRPHRGCTCTRPPARAQWRGGVDMRAWSELASAANA